MAGQSITFDFLTTGADRTASGFRKVADNTVLAARGAKVLSDAIERLGAKEDRTAAESKILASALRQTGDAEDRMAAKAVLADAAIRRLADAEQDASKKSDGLKKSLGGLKLNPGLVGPALLLAPALASLTGVAAGAAVALGGAFVAGGAALAAFGAVAKPVLADAKTAAAAVEKAQNNYTAAIAGGTKQSVAYKAEQIAIAKAYAGLSPAQIALSKQLGTMASAWDAVKAAETPVVAGALQPWLKSVTDLTKQLAPIIAKVAPVIQYLGGQLDNLINSSAFKAFRDFIGSTGAAAVSAGGSTIIDLVKAFIILLPKFDPLIREAVGWISRLGPAVLTWASSKKASDDITKFMQWFSQNGPAVGSFLKSIGAALAALAPGLTAGGTLEIKAVTDFLNFIAKLPPSIAKPLAEVAAALLILQKTGVVTAGVKLVGLTGLSAPAAAVGAGIAAGIVFKIREDLQSGFKGIIRDIPNWFSFGSLGAIVTSAQGWADLIVSKVRHALLSWEDDVRHHIAVTFDGIRHDVSARWDGLMTDIATMMDIAKEHIRITWDQIKILFLRGVSDVISIMAKLPGPLGAPFKAAQRSIAGDLARIQGDVRTATGNIQADWDRLHGKTLTLQMIASGQGGVKVFSQGLAAKEIMLSKLAGGGMVRMGSGPTADDVPAMLSHGEFVHKAKAVNQYGVPAMEAVNAGKAVIGFAGGGFAKLGRQSAALQGAVSSAMGADTQAWLAKDLAAVLKSMKQQILNALAGNGPAIVRYARSFLGKIPYRFGGTGLTADDCSGFTQAIYGRFGIHAPRTSEAQYAWATRSAPVPGSLAFYVSSAGGPPPGHVAIVQDASTVISQGGPEGVLGPRLMGLHAMPLMGTGVPKGGLPASAGGVGNAAPTGSLQVIAQSLLAQRGWSPQWPSFNALENREAGWNLTARNPSSGAYGLAQFINGAGEYYQYGGNPNTGVGQLTAMMNYIRQRYGNPVNAWDHESLFGWYGKGGLVPGYASGGSVAAQGRQFLDAWRSRHGGPYALAVGPKTLDQQIPAMAAAVGRARTLAGAPGLSGGQHRFWASAAASESRLLGTLRKELGTEQAWRGQLGLSELTLDKEIKAAGNLPGLAGPVRGWKAQLAADKRTVSAISQMIGLTSAQQAAAVKKAGGPPLPPVPPVQHTYGGDVANTIGAFLSSVAAPFGAARGGMVFDRGGTLAPGYNAVWNKTGRPEPLVPARAGGGGKLQIEWVGGNGGDELTAWIRKNVRVRGGGDVQKAFGAR